MKTTSKSEINIVEEAVSKIYNMSDAKLNKLIGKKQDWEDLFYLREWCISILGRVPE